MAGRQIPDELKVTRCGDTTRCVVGDRLRGLRQDRGWSAREVAERCEHHLMTRGTIGKIESGTRMFVTYDELDALAHVFGLTRDEFLHRRPRADVAGR